jgi:hypothetical protein
VKDGRSSRGSRSNQYEDEESFTEVGEWLPWRSDRSGKLICEVAAARFQLARPTEPDQPLAVRVALIRETTAKQANAVELALTYFRRWNCQENAIRDWLIPLNLDTNHGYAKEPVVNSELVKQRAALEKRLAHLHRLAAQSRKRLRQMGECNQVRARQVVSWEQKQQDLLAQVTALETIGQSGEPDLLAIKAQQLEAEWEVHHRRVLLEATSIAGKRELNHCEQSCRVLRQVLRKPRRASSMRT